MLSPIVMCGPRGLHFNVPVELRVPHYGSIDLDGWSVALKSSNIHNGKSLPIHGGQTNPYLQCPSPRGNPFSQVNLLAGEVCP